MKGIMKMIVLSSMFLISSQVMADNATSTQPETTSPTTAQPAATTHTGMWICTTNASSPTSGSPDEQADQTMAKNADAGNSAFDFALKNCRDCTKITCELQTEPAE